MKELILIFGLPWSGKYEYILETFPNYQTIFPYAIKKAMEYVRINKEEKTLYLIAETAARALMIYDLPTAIIEHDIGIETVFIWKKIAIEHGYKIKVLLFDVPLEECFSRHDKRNKESLKYLSEESKKFEQLKHILNMEHQSIVNEVEVIKPSMEEDKDEVL